MDIRPRPEKILRDKKPKSNLENVNFIVSKSDKVSEFVLNGVRNENIDSSIFFNIKNNIAKIKLAGSDPNGEIRIIDLYKELIKYLKNINIDFIESDNTVQGGALVAWMKLAEEGFNVEINPKILDKFTEFKNVYNKGLFYKETISVYDHNIPESKDDFVFKLSL